MFLFDKDVSKWDMLWWKKKKCIPLNGYCPFSLGKGRVKIGRKEQIVNSQQNMQTQKRILHWSFGFYQFYEACPKYLNGLSRESSPHCRSFQTELNGTEILEIYKIRTESYCREIGCKKQAKICQDFTASASFHLSITCLNRFHLENVCAVDFWNDCAGFKTSGKG